MRAEKAIQHTVVTVIPIVVWTLGTVPKNMEKRFDELDNSERYETIQTTGSLNSARILRKVLVMRGNLLSQVQ